MKLGIVGSGLVGSTAAYAAVLLKSCEEIVLLDRDRDRAEAEAADIRHALPHVRPAAVRAGDYADLAGAGVVILTAGVSQKPGETRPQLLGRNAAVFSDVVPRVAAQAPGAVLLVATNPVDVMTHLAARYAAPLGVPSSRVIGSGTTLDTARFRAELGAMLDVDPRNVHGYVVGEHGDTEVLTWSLVDIGGVRLTDYARARGIVLDGRARRDIDDRVRGAAYRIIAGKGATYYGIGAALARIVEAIGRDQRAVLTVCTPLPEVAGARDVTVSLPWLVGREGALAPLPLALDADEEAALGRSARAVGEMLAAVGSSG